MVMRKQPAKAKAAKEGLPTSASSSISKRAWQVDDRLECRSSNDGQYYEAKIVQITKYEDVLVYRVHYMGWNSGHDEDVYEEEVENRFGALVEQTSKRTRGRMPAVTSSQDEKRCAKFSVKKTPVTRSKTLKDIDSAKEIKHPIVKASLSCQPKACEKIGSSIVLTDALRKVLEEDRNLLLGELMLPKVPARVPLTEIIRQYRSWQKSGESEVEAMHPKIKKEYFRTLVCSVQNENDLFAAGLLDCFEGMFFDRDLLYNHEVPMYEDVVCKARRVTGASDVGKFLDDQLPPASQFGLVYLLRMLVKFSPALVASTQLQEEEVSKLINRAHDLISFLDKNHAKFYSGKAEYRFSSLDYLDRVEALYSSSKSSV
uniref:MRG domain-containing protein n=1 Tax=Ditylenchus dipsaci TaxID=166011 RepID=A0A915E128_9BILA